MSGEIEVLDQGVEMSPEEVAERITQAHLKTRARSENPKKPLPCCVSPCYFIPVPKKLLWYSGLALVGAGFGYLAFLFFLKPNAVGPSLE